MRKKYRVDLYHNLLWSKYKGAVFTQLSTLCKNTDLDISFTQIAETDNERSSLSPVDLSYHNYNYKLLFRGSYNGVIKTTMIRRLFVEVFNSNADLILLPGYHKLEFWGMLVAAIMRNKKVGVFCDSTAHDRPKKIINTLLKKIFFSRCVVFFTYGTRGREYLLSLGAKRKDIFIRCQAASLPHEYRRNEAFERRVQLASPKENPRFLYVGRLSSEKGLETLFRAIELLSAHAQNAVLIVAGSGPLRASLEKLASSLNISDRIIFEGAMDHQSLAVQYLRATSLILPSTSEPWGLVVNEALSYGCPVIVSHVCGCVPELVHNKKTGLIFSSGNAQDLTRKMMIMINLPFDIDVIASNCLRLMKNYTPLNAARNIENAIRSTIERK